MFLDLYIVHLHLLAIAARILWRLDLLRRAARRQSLHIGVTV
jgi:hypothetical protein